MATPPVFLPGEPHGQYEKAKRTEYKTICIISLERHSRNSVYNGKVWHSAMYSHHFSDLIYFRGVWIFFFFFFCILSFLKKIIWEEGKSVSPTKVLIYVTFLCSDLTRIHSFFPFLQLGTHSQQQSWIPKKKLVLLCGHQYFWWGVRLRRGEFMQLGSSPGE